MIPPSLPQCDPKFGATLVGYLFKTSFYLVCCVIVHHLYIVLNKILKLEIGRAKFHPPSSISLTGEKDKYIISIVYMDHTKIQENMKISKINFSFSIFFGSLWCTTTKIFPKIKCFAKYFISWNLELSTPSLDIEYMIYHG